MFSFERIDLVRKTFSSREYHQLYPYNLNHRLDWQTSFVIYTSQ